MYYKRGGRGTDASSWFITLVQKTATIFNTCNVYLYSLFFVVSISLFHYSVLDDN